MKEEQFDDLARLVASKTSRRQMLKVLGGFAFGSLNLGAIVGLNMAQAPGAEARGKPCDDSCKCGTCEICSSGTCIPGPFFGQPGGFCTKCPKGLCCGNLGICEVLPGCGSPGGGPPGGSQGCSSGLTRCNGKCVDTSSSRTNCGGCGITCSQLEDCCGGTCINKQTSPSNCGQCGFQCPTPPNATATCTNGTCGFTCNSGSQLCGGNCVSNTCAPGQRFETLTCQCVSTGTCPDGYTLCSGTETCVPSVCGVGQTFNATTCQCECTSNQDTCTSSGGQTVTCACGHVCINGLCQCPSNTNTCGDFCCGSGAFCHSGQCLAGCLPGEVPCNGYCCGTADFCCGPNECIPGAICASCRPQGQPCTRGGQCCSGNCVSGLCQ